MKCLYKDEKRVATEAVIHAITLAQQMQGQLTARDIVNKEDLSPVTIADLSIQTLINTHLINAFPSDPIIGEEDSFFLKSPDHPHVKEKVVEELNKIVPGISENTILDVIDRGNQGRSQERFWVLDPIDGTRGFIQNEAYAIALALIENGKVVLGILGCPVSRFNGHLTGGIFSATASHGSMFTPLQEKKSIPVKVRASSEKLIYCEAHATSKTHSHSDAFEIAKKIHAHPHPLRLDSQCKYAHVAFGDASLYLRIPVLNARPEQIWDHAAGTIILEEAGGKVTDMLGQPLDFTQGTTLSNNVGIVATNGFIHDRVIEAIQTGF